MDQWWARPFYPSTYSGAASYVYNRLPGIPYREAIVGAASSVPMPSRETAIKTAKIATGATVVVAAAPVALSAAGFTASGVAAGSVAAGVQSWIGNVAAGSVFAGCQSAGVLGFALKTKAVLGAAGATLGYYFPTNRNSPPPEN